MAGLLRAAFGGVDPGAFSRGAERQLRLQELQRANQTRLNLQQYAPQQTSQAVSTPAAPVYDPNAFAIQQRTPLENEYDVTIGPDGGYTAHAVVPRPPEITIEELPPPPPPADKNAGLSIPSSTVIMPKADQVGTPTFKGEVTTVEPKEGTDVEKIDLQVQGMPWKVIEKDGGKVVVHNGVEYNISDPIGDGSSLILVDRYGRPNYPLTQQFTAARAEGITNTETEGSEVKSVEEIKDTAEEAIDEADKEKVTIKNTGQVVTEKVDGITDAGTAVERTDPNTVTAVIGGSAETEGAVDVPSVYIKNPSKAGYDIQKALRNRQASVSVLQEQNKKTLDYQKIAEIYRISGDMDNYFKYQTIIDQAKSIAQGTQQTIREYNESIIYLQGMQGLADLAYGNNTNRLSMVWSEYSGRQVRIAPRTDGLFDIFMDGQMVETGLTKADVSSMAQLQFDSEYRAKMAGRKDAAFESMLQTQEEKEKIIAETLKQITIENVKGEAAIQLEMIKKSATSFTSTGNGEGVAIINGMPYYFSPQTPLYRPGEDEPYDYGAGLVPLGSNTALGLIYGNQGNGNPQVNIPNPYMSQPDVAAAIENQQKATNTEEK